MTERYSDVASCPTLGRWAARPSLARTTVAWRGLGPRDQEKRTRHAPLGGYVRVLVDYTAVQQQQSVTKLNTKHQDGLALAHSPRLLAARQEAIGLGSYAWILRAGQRTRRVSSRRPTS